MDNKRYRIEIGSNAYHVRKFEPFLALQVLGELQKQLIGPVMGVVAALRPSAKPGPAPDALPKVEGDEAEVGALSAGLARVASPVGKSWLDADIDVPTVSAAVTRLSHAMSGDDLMRIAGLLLRKEYVTIQPDMQGDGVKLDDIAVTQYMEGAEDIVLLCVEIVRINYAGFTQRAMSLFGRAS